VVLQSAIAHGHVVVSIGMHSENTACSVRLQLIESTEEFTNLQQFDDSNECMLLGGKLNMKRECVYLLPHNKVIHCTDRYANVESMHPCA
jgi:hypothetical protein